MQRDTPPRKACAPVTWFLVIHDKRNTMLLNGPTAHLTAAVCRANDLGPQLYIDLPGIRDTCSFARVPVQNDRPFLPSDFLNSFFLLNNEPLFEVSFSPVEVRLVFGTQSLFF
jgi:hypothetical protein